jgi:uncharacterized membrane protein
MAQTLTRAANADGAVKLGRIVAIDVARGVALAGMVVYHLIWDFAHFSLVAPSLPFEPATRVFSHVVASAFLGLVGVSLALAHPHGLNRPAFARRLAIVVGAAALVTLASYFVDPAEPILFGILHCIALASVIGALFVAAPPWAPLLIGAMAITEPLVFSSDVFNAPALIWLGLGTTMPATLDWRPLLPWAGVVLIGLGLARAALPRLASWRWASWRPANLPGRAFAYAGRHSLAIYLVHQPILFGLLWAVVATGVFAEHRARVDYLAACAPACVAHGGDAGVCTKACACVAERAGAAGVSLNAAREGGADDVTARLRDIVGVCSVEAQ